ncbi:MAG: pyridoxal-phosphate dependent enzyme, partial [Gemmatimonadaceae bacterium]
MTSPFDSQPLHDAVVEAYARLRPFIRETPLEESPALGLEKKSGSSGSTVFLKLENLQHTGSFKARGALNRLLCLTQQERGQGVVTASSGNHGAGVAWASAQLGIEATVFVPEQASSAKVSLIERYGATVHRVGIDGLDTELHARDVG